MLAVALAFTGPVVEALGLEPPMIQLFGAPGSGKTSIGAAVGSVWGGGEDGLFLQSWNHTANNAERLAAAFHSTFLLMDETRTADQTQAGKTPPILQLVMRLAGGQVRGRLTDACAPCAPLLSLSNGSLDEMAQRAQVEIDDAHRGRLIDVPLASGVVGAFENLHGLENHAAFSIELRRIAKSDHGRAAREFLRRFAADLRRDKPSIVAWLEARRAWYLGRVRPASSRQIATSSVSTRSLRPSTPQAVWRSGTASCPGNKGSWVARWWLASRRTSTTSRSLYLRPPRPPRGPPAPSSIRLSVCAPTIGKTSRSSLIYETDWLITAAATATIRVLATSIAGAMVPRNYCSRMPSFFGCAGASLRYSS